jgi:hypothetical protein
MALEVHTFQMAMEVHTFQMAMEVHTEDPLTGASSLPLEHQTCHWIHPSIRTWECGDR